MPRNWQAVVDGLSDVGKLVHLAARWDAFDVEAKRGSILRDMRAAYNDEMNIQARNAGCGDKLGRMREGSPALPQLRDRAQIHAESIVNTFNYDLAIAIAHIRQAVPTANRYTYVARLRPWYESRAAWKDPQIANMVEADARTFAQQDFTEINRLRGMGTARLEPRTAVCQICQGWINRGNVPLRVAMANPGPWHVGCPHYFVITYDRMTPEQCRDLWMGE